jgi:hypothetical protein
MSVDWQTVEQSPEFREHGAELASEAPEPAAAEPVGAR